MQCYRLEARRINVHCGALTERWTVTNAADLLSANRIDFNGTVNWVNQGRVVDRLNVDKLEKSRAEYIAK